MILMNQLPEQALYWPILCWQGWWEWGGGWFVFADQHGGQLSAQFFKAPSYMVPEGTSMSAKSYEEMAKSWRPCP